MRSWQLPRRTILKGMGYSILLPMLDVMMPSDAKAANTVSPRFVSMFLSLGIYGRGYDPTKSGAARYPQMHAWEPGGLGAWAPATTGALTAKLPPILAPLESLKQKISILSGLGTFVDNPRGRSINHSAATTLWSTSAWKTDTEATKVNILPGGGGFTKANDNPPDSIDQYIANALGLTPGSTLALNPMGYDYSESGQGGHGGAVSYNSKLSAGGSSILPRVNSPTKAFDSLFATCKKNPNGNKPTPQQLSQKSVLDYVMGSITETQKKVSTQDKARLDSYFQNIRDLEKKLTAVQACPDAPTASPALTGGPLDNISNLNMMVDVVALAISSGAMPIATLMTAVEADACSYAYAGVDYLSTYVGINGTKVKYHSSGLSTHFDIAHIEGDSTQAIEEHIAYAQMNMSFVKRLVENLNSMPVEPNGLTPLDNTIILAGAAHANSRDHDTHNLPTLLAGGKGFGLNQGQHIAFPMVTDMGDFYYTMAKAMGVAGTSFNGHNKVLPGVFL